MSLSTCLLNQPIVPQQAFQDPLANYFFLSSMVSFDESTATGKVKAIRYRRKVRLSFNQEMLPFERAQGWEFPDAYGNDKVITFKLFFPSEDIVRFIFDVSKDGNKLDHPLDPMVEDSSLLSAMEDWVLKSSDSKAITYESSKLKVTLFKDPFKVVVSNAEGKILYDIVSIHEKEGLMNDNPIPFGFMQRIGNKGTTNLLFQQDFPR